MTFDGAPLNDPAEHALFFNNFHDFTSAVDSIQIQRGVGTSSVGSPSYGGSVNFASAPAAAARRRRPATRPRLLRHAAGLGRLRVRLLDNGLFASARVSYADTDGYRERFGQRAPDAVSERRLAGRAVVAQVRLVLRRRGVAAVLPGRRPRHAAREPTLQPAGRGGARQLRPGLRPAPVHPRGRQRHAADRLALLQRRRRLVRAVGRPGGARTTCCASGSTSRSSARWSRSAGAASACRPPSASTTTTSTATTPSTSAAGGST